MVRSHRNKKIVSLVDNQIKLEETEAEINISRIIGEYSRSRTNSELYRLIQEELMPEILAAHKHWIVTDDPDTIQFLKDQGCDLDNFVWEDAMAELARITYGDRRKCRQFRERVTKLEYKRMNKVIQRYLEVQARKRPIFIHNIGVKAILQL